jgi:hypothetical protein
MLHEYWKSSIKNILEYIIHEIPSPKEKGNDNVALSNLFKRFMFLPHANLLHYPQRNVRCQRTKLLARRCWEEGSRCRPISALFLPMAGTLPAASSPGRSLFYSMHGR